MSRVVPIALMHKKQLFARQTTKPLSPRTTAWWNRLSSTRASDAERRAGAGAWWWRMMRKVSVIGSRRPLQVGGQHAEMQILARVGLNMEFGCRRSTARCDVAGSGGFSRCKLSYERFNSADSAESLIARTQITAHRGSRIRCWLTIHNTTDSWQGSLWICDVGRMQLYRKQSSDQENQECDLG